MKTYIANCIERMKPSFIINLIDRGDGNKKKQGLEKIPRESVFKARMLKFAGWQIVVWDENGNCIEHPQSQTDNAVAFIS